MHVQRRTAGAVAISVGPREIGTTPEFGTELDEQRRRCQPFELHTVLGVAVTEHRLIHQRCIGKIAGMRMLLVDVANAGTEAPGLEADTVTDRQRLEPGFLDIRLAVGHGDDGLTTPVGIDIGGEYQLGLVSRKAARIGPLDLGREKAGDAAVGNVLGSADFALQDQRHLRVESTG